MSGGSVWRSTEVALLVLGVVACFGTTLSGQDASSGTARRVLWTTSQVNGTPEPPAPYRTERVFPRIQFQEPLEADAVPGTNLLFVAERYGKVRSLENRNDATQAEVVLDLGKVIYGLACHPKFATNGYLYVTYVLDPAKEEPLGTRLARFTAKKNSQGQYQVDPQTEQILLEWPSGGHNGGCLRFGKDGMLYIATGDSSGINDQRLTGQDLSDLSGAILRIDVDHPEADRKYSIPRDNPFRELAGARPENWAYGLRQPWKMHFDRETGDLWTGNVGQDLWEQVLLVERGGNYGWSVTEGSHPFRPERPRGPSEFLPPIAEHDHAEFRSITGGVLYRGRLLPELRGAYLYGDYDTGKLWSLRYDRTTRRLSDWRELVDTNLRIVGFLEDQQGEFYLIDHMGGALHRVVKNAATDQSASFPRLLSQTGLFTHVARHELAPGVLPYQVIAPQWADGATKQRFFGLPGESRIEFEAVTYPQPAPGAPPGWRFPHGTVLAETLSLELEPGNPASRQRVETRLLHYEQLSGTEEVGDQFWRGYSYRWNEAQTDAVLVESGGGEVRLSLNDREAPGGKRTQTWRIPSRAECTICHNMAAKYVLGLTTHQTDCPGEAGSAANNQLQRWSDLGLFTKPVSPRPESVVRLVDYSDTRAALDARARSYLHANCSHCHRKWGGGNTEFQLLATLPLGELGIANEKPAHGGFFLADARILAPGDPLRSTLYYRAAKLGPGRMPRLGSDVVDDAGVALLHDWIASLDKPASPPAPAAEVAARAALAAMPRPIGEELDRLVTTVLGSTRSALAVSRDLDRGAIGGPVRDTIVAKAAGMPDAHIRDLFEKYLPEEQRPKRLGTAIQPSVLLAMTGDAAAGRRLFFDTAGVQCRNCHQIQGQGTAIGPELTTIGKKYDRAKLLDNILNPSREIDPKYLVHLAQTNDGRLLTGLLVERTEQVVVLKDAKNQLVRIPASDVEALVPQQQSLMPDLLLRDLTAQQVADLLAFLSSLGTTSP